MFSIQHFLFKKLPSIINLIFWINRNIENRVVLKSELYAFLYFGFTHKLIINLLNFRILDSIMIGKP